MHRITTPHVEIDSGFSAPQIRDFAVPFDVTGFFVFVGPSIRLQLTPLASYRVKEVHLGGRDDYV